jgi:hypothetical protein
MIWICYSWSLATRWLVLTDVHPTNVDCPGKFVLPILVEDFIVSISTLIFVVGWERKLFVGTSMET